MRRVLLAVALTLLVAVPGSIAAAPKVFQGWTGNSDVVSNGGSVELSQGGSLMVDPGCVDLEDNTNGPTHGINVCNWGIALLRWPAPGVQPVSRAYLLVGPTDPRLGTDVDPPAGSLYLQSQDDTSGALWVKTGATNATFTCLAGCTP